MWPRVRGTGAHGRSHVPYRQHGEDQCGDKGASQAGSVKWLRLCFVWLLFLLIFPACFSSSPSDALSFVYILFWLWLTIYFILLSNKNPDQYISTLKLLGCVVIFYPIMFMVYLITFYILEWVGVYLEMREIGNPYFPFFFILP